MKKSIISFALVMFAATLFVISTAVIAAEEKKSEGKEKVFSTMGAVKVKKTGEKVESVKIGPVNITMDEMGSDLAALMAGKKSQVAGTIEDKEGAKWVTLRSFTATVVGTVKVTRGDNKKIESIKVESELGDFNVTLDQNAEKLVKQDGKSVDATGVVYTKEGAKMLTVQSSRLHREATTKKDEEKPGGRLGN